jgi:hypothetical protein
VRGHFGRYEPIDFLALLIGYAVSGERILADFFERVSPFGSAFIALGWRVLPFPIAQHSPVFSPMSMALVRKALRTPFEQFSFPR